MPDQDNLPEDSARRGMLFGMAAAPLAPLAGSVDVPNAAAILAEKVRQVALMRGFPISGIRGAAGVFKFAGMRVQSGAGSLLRSIMGDGDFPRTTGAEARDYSDTPWGQEGYLRQNRDKIEIYDELELYKVLRQLPNNLPLRDLLSDDLIFYLYGDSNAALLKEARHFRDALAPILDDTMRAGDVVERLHIFFQKCADHAIKDPGHFVFSADGDMWDERSFMRGSSQLENVLKILSRQVERTEIPNPSIQLLRDRYKDFKEGMLDQAFAEHKRASPEEDAQPDSGKMRAEKEKERLEKPKVRSHHSVNLQHRDGWTFEVSLIHPEHATPTRMDWMHWAQGIDDEALPCDFKLSDDMKAITIKSNKLQQVAIDNSHGTGRYRITLPNLRMYVDLGQEKIIKPLTEPIVDVVERPVWDVRSLKPVASASFINPDEQTAYTQERFAALASLSQRLKCTP